MMEGLAPNSSIRYITSDACTDVKEIFETYREEYGIDGGSASVKIRVPTEEYAAAIIHLLEEGSIGSAENRRATSVEFPRQITSSQSTLRVTNITVTPVPSEYQEEGQAIKYPWMELTISYGFLETEINLEPTAEFLILPASEFWWHNGSSDNRAGLAQDEAPGMLKVGMNVSLRRKYVDMGSFDPLSFIGKVNDSNITLSAFPQTTFPAETLLFNPPTFTNGLHLSSNRFWDVNMRFTYNPWTWNKFFRGDADGNISEKFQSIYDKNGSVFKPYETADFSSILELMQVAT